MLQLHVSRLRQALKASGRGHERAVVTRPPGYLLDLAPDDVDALGFERLVAEGRGGLDAGNPAEASRLLGEALGLWRGEALADFAYDDFAASDRAHLGELCLSATEDRIEADLALGRHIECAEELERLVRTHAPRERLWVS